MYAHEGTHRISKEGLGPIYRLTERVERPTEILVEAVRNRNFGDRAGRAIAVDIFKDENLSLPKIAN